MTYYQYQERFLNVTDLIRQIPAETKCSLVSLSQKVTKLSQSFANGLLLTA